MQNRIIRRGELYYMNLGYQKGSTQEGSRPVLVIQNNTGNYYSNTVIVAPITSKIKKLYMPTHVLLYPGSTGLKKTSMVLLEQIMTVNKEQLLSCLGQTSDRDLYRINRAICVSTGLPIHESRMNAKQHGR